MEVIIKYPTVIAMRISCYFLGLCLILPAVVSAEIKAADNEWPQWRGPNRDAIARETGLLKQWPTQGPPLAWAAKGLGRGYSSISIAGGKIFTMGDRQGQMHVIALDANNGQEAWATPIGKPWGDGGPRSTPTVDGDTVFAITPHGELVCLDAMSGSEHWRKSFPGDFGGKMMSGWGYCESPLIDGPHLLCTPGSDQAMMVALDKKTGRQAWACAMPAAAGGKEGAGYSSIVISNGGGTKQYVQLIGRGVIGVSARDGKLLWGYNKVANGTANIPTPIVSGDFVFCSTGYQTGAALLKLSKKGRTVAANEVYFLDSQTLQNHHGGMVLSGNHIYCGHGHNNGFPLCLELKTGKVAWKAGRGPGSGSAAIVEADGHIYFRYENGVMALIEANPREYRLKGSFQIPNSSPPSWSHPVVAGGKLYLREQDALLCYDLRAGKG